MKDRSFDKGKPDPRIHGDLFVQARPITGRPGEWTLCVWSKGAGNYLPVDFQTQDAAETAAAALTKALAGPAARYQRLARERQDDTARRKERAAARRMKKMGAAA